VPGRKRQLDRWPVLVGNGIDGTNSSPHDDNMVV
jgi:hypothetical protein